MKKIRVHRDTVWPGMATSIHLKLNGNKVAKIYNKEWIEIPLVNDEATLQSTTFGQKSNKVNVHDGNDYILSSTTWGLYGYILIFVLLILSNLLSNVFLSRAALVLTLIILVTAFIPGIQHKLDQLE